MNGMHLRAWVDESQSDRTRDPGTYVLAAAIGAGSSEPGIRERIAALRLPGQRKLHWRDESEARRALIANTVAACDLEHLVVVRAGTEQDRPERRRRKCLERLLFELETRWSVADVVLESRGPADDRRDMDLVNALRGQQHLSSQLRMDHRIGRSEPMLWIPDAICGVITSARTGKTRHRESLGAGLTVVEI